jgi:hypothetical protein
MKHRAKTVCTGTAQKLKFDPEMDLFDEYYSKYQKYSVWTPSAQISRATVEHLEYQLDNKWVLDST